MIKDGFSESMPFSGAKCNGVEEFSFLCTKKAPGEWIPALGFDPAWFIEPRTPIKELINNR